MRDYAELVRKLREADEKSMCGECGMNLHSGTTKKGVLFAEAADAIEELMGRTKVLEKVADKWCEAAPKWISVEEPPNNDRNIFICHGSADFKAPCIGHYDPGMKLFYEDKNWFASPIYDAMFWCEMPKLPLPEPPGEET